MKRQHYYDVRSLPENRQERSYVPHVIFILVMIFVQGYFS